MSQEVIEMSDYFKPEQKRISFMIDEDLYEELRTLSQQSGRSLSGYLRHALKLHLYIVNRLSH